MSAGSLNVMRMMMLRFLALFILSFILTLPFPYTFLPDIGEFIHPLSEILVRWAGDHILRIEHPYTAAIISDSTGMYIHVLILLAFSAIGALIWSMFRKGSPEGFLPLLHTVASYYLALQLFKYGFGKLFKSQFYLPEPNNLHTPLGHLSRDILYWSTIGSSYPYSVATGILEIIPAVLLLFRRTRLIGGMWALAVIVHIVLINFAFDISVKLYSLVLLLLSLVVAYPGLISLFDLFIMNRQARPWGARPEFSSGKRIILYSACKALVIVAILFEALLVYFKEWNFNDDRAPRPFLHGAYVVETFIRNGDTLPPFPDNGSRFRRFFIHRNGYFITQSPDDTMRDYRLDYDLVHRTLTMSLHGDSIMILGYSVPGTDSSRLILRGRRGVDSVVIDARKIDLTELPLLQPSFHWTIDDYRKAGK